MKKLISRGTRNESSELPQFSFNRISKSLGGIPVLREVSMEIAGGDIILLLGPNGAGKTTLLRILAGTLRSDSGSSPFSNSGTAKHWRGQIGYYGPQPFLYNRLSVQENIELFALKHPNLSASQALEAWRLDSLASIQVGNLSKGQVALVSLCRALLGKPKVIILDEPSSFLDDSNVELLWSHLKKAQAECPGLRLVVASHDVRRLAPWATRVAVIINGAVVMNSSGSTSSDEISKFIHDYQGLNR